MARKLAGKNYVTRVLAKILLSGGSLDFEELSDQKKKDKFSIPARDVRKVETPLTMAVPDPTYVGQRIHCPRDLRKLGGPRGKNRCHDADHSLPALVHHGEMVHRSPFAKWPHSFLLFGRSR
jgi:hypothetical protein